MAFVLPVRSKMGVSVAALAVEAAKANDPPIPARTASMAPARLAMAGTPGRRERNFVRAFIWFLSLLCQSARRAPDGSLFLLVKQVGRDAKVYPTEILVEAKTGSYPCQLPPLLLICSTGGGRRS